MAPKKNKRRKVEVSEVNVTPQAFLGQDFQKLLENCLATKQKFTDDKFPADRRSIGSGQMTYTKMATVVWKRPSELVKNPRFVVTDESRFDYSQGELGNCWFLASVAAITLQKEIMDQIVPVDQSFTNNYAGIFHFKFCRNGTWLDVVIDDQLPTINGQPIFIHSKTQNEFWPALLEKAYAKLFGSYAALNGGYVVDALSDFTGGAYKSFNLRNSPELMWELMERAVKSKALLGCGTPNGATSANTVLPNGMVEGHAYTITEVTKLQVKSKVVKLVRVLNPWGEGEWKGNWSDRSPLWKEVSKQDREKWLEVKNNGEFWMSLEDFCKNFSELYICCITNDFLI